MTPHPLRLAAAFLGAAASGLHGASAPINLWPGTAPGEKAPLTEVMDATKDSDPKTGGSHVIRTGNVAVPTLELYRALPYKDTGTTVIVYPGGGYYILAWDLEGLEVCDWLNSIGVNAVLVKYRVPRREGLPKHLPALQDAQRAISLVRSKAAEWGIDPHRVGVLGFSAGGHLCATLSASTERAYPRVDAADDQGFHPDFQVLVYPAYLLPDPKVYTLAPEVAVTAATPATFMVMAEDDGEHPENVLAYAMALKAAKVPMELHLYPTGGHGYGLRPTANYVTTWPARAADWMRSRGLLGAK
jgi:acetyl esterase/lipase